MSNWTYTKQAKPEANVEKLLELWESFGATGLFRLEVDYLYGLAHVYHLKGTKIQIRASSDGPDHYNLLITDDDIPVSAEEFWNRIPKDKQKILAFHLDQLV